MRLQSFGYLHEIAGVVAAGGLGFGDFDQDDVAAVDDTMPEDLSQQLAAGNADAEGPMSTPRRLASPLSANADRVTVCSRSSG